MLGPKPWVGDLFFFHCSDNGRSAVTSGEEADSPWQCLEQLHNQWWCRSPADTPCPEVPCGPLWPGRSQPPQCTQRMCCSPWSGRGSCLCRRNGLSHLASSLCLGWAWGIRHKHRSDNRSVARGKVFTLEADLHSCFNPRRLPDLLAQVGFGILAELALSTLWDVQGYDRVP